MPAPNAAPAPRYLAAALLVLWAAIFAIALSGYPKLLDNERRVGGYVLDAVQNGHWIVQRDFTGDIASKPPVLTWIASLSTLCFGGVINRFSIYLPSALATLGTALLLLAAGRREFGWRAGFLAALIYLLSYIADAQVVTARYDGVFSFPVLLAALAAYRGWRTGHGWFAFWLAATLATMVKGPLGVVLAASGLLAMFWERRSGAGLPLRGSVVSHLAGLALFLIVCGGWLALAYRELGPPLIAKLFGRELVEHVVHEGEYSPGQRFWEPSWNTFRDFLPWSIAGLAAFWRVLRRPAGNSEERRFERFIFCWVMVSIVLFSVAAHQRGRLVWPLVPAIALLAGRELNIWIQGISRRRLLQFSTALSAFVLVGLTVFHHFLQKRSRDVRTTLAMRTMAEHIKREGGAQFPISYSLDAPFALQFYMNTVRPGLRMPEMAELLRGEAAAYVVVRNFERLQQFVGSNNPLFVLYHVPGNVEVRLVSNHPKLEWSPLMATSIGGVHLRIEDSRLEQATDRGISFSAAGASPSVTCSNASTNAVTFRVRWGNGDFRPEEIQPGQVIRSTPDLKHP